MSSYSLERIRSQGETTKNFPLVEQIEGEESDIPFTAEEVTPVLDALSGLRLLHLSQEILIREKHPEEPEEVYRRNQKLKPIPPFYNADPSLLEKMRREFVQELTGGKASSLGSTTFNIDPSTGYRAGVIPILDCLFISANDRDLINPPLLGQVTVVSQVTQNPEHITITIGVDDYDLRRKREIGIIFPRDEKKSQKNLQVIMISPSEYSTEDKSHAVGSRFDLTKKNDPQGVPFVVGSVWKLGNEKSDIPHRLAMQLMGITVAEYDNLWAALKNLHQAIWERQWRFEFLHTLALLEVLSGKFEISTRAIERKLREDPFEELKETSHRRQIRETFSRFLRLIPGLTGAEDMVKTLEREDAIDAKDGLVAAHIPQTNGEYANISVSYSKPEKEQSESYEHYATVELERAKGNEKAIVHLSYSLEGELLGGTVTTQVMRNDSQEFAQAGYLTFDAQGYVINVSGDMKNPFNEGYSLDPALLVQIVTK